MNDNMTISLLTCGPGDELYSLFGHTAIRVKTEGVDAAFNYGAFNYSEDNFAYKFVAGETDYILAAEPTEMFLARYDERGIGVTEQVLNLTQEEKEDIYAYLRWNVRPENRMYRYNWLYDNCTTRARSLLRKVQEVQEVQGFKSSKVQGLKSSKVQGVHPSTSSGTDVVTAREILKEYTQVDSWVDFGIDMILGSEIDQPLTQEQQMFIPANYEAELEGSRVQETLELLPQRLEHEHYKVNQPMLVFGALLLVCVGASVMEWKRKKLWKWLDVALFSLVGIAGVLISFLYFFSEHAGVDTNALVWIFNPVALLMVPLIVKGKHKVAGMVMMVEIAIFVIAVVGSGQWINPAMWILALSLLVRSIASCIVVETK